MATKLLMAKSPEEAAVSKTASAAFVAGGTEVNRLGSDIAEKAEGFRTLQTSFALPLCAEPAEGGPLKVAVAKDEAFCFYYEDNLDMLPQNHK